MMMSDLNYLTRLSDFEVELNFSRHFLKIVKNDLSEGLFVLL